MNFTSYESGFGARGTAGGAPSLQNGNSQRGLQNDGFNQMKGQASSNNRNGPGLLNQNSMMKSHQQLGQPGLAQSNIYTNMGNQTSQYGQNK